MVSTTISECSPVIGNVAATKHNGHSTSTSTSTSSSNSNSNSGGSSNNNKRRQRFYKLIKGRFTSVANDESDALEPPKGLFGAPLVYAIQARSSSVTPHGLIVPDPVEKCFTEIMERGLGIEGLFRLSGAASDVRRLANEFDSQNKDIDLSTYDIHTITGVAKKYLRALPDPVIPRPFHSSFLQVASSPSDMAPDQLAHLIAELPRLHRHLLCYMLILAGAIQDRQDVNMMNPEALAVVLSPVSTGLEQTLEYNMITSSRSSSSSSSSSRRRRHRMPRKEEMTNLVKTNAQWTVVWTYMIEHHQTLLDRCMPGPNEEEQNQPTTTTRFPDLFGTAPAPRRAAPSHHDGWRSLFSPPEGAKRVLRRLASSSSMRPPSVQHWI